jgi:hypothetical protein
MCQWRVAAQIQSASLLVIYQREPIIFVMSGEEEMIVVIECTKT